MKFNSRALFLLIAICALISLASCNISIKGDAGITVTPTDATTAAIITLPPVTNEAGDIIDEPEAVTTTNAIVTTSPIVTTAASPTVTTTKNDSPLFNPTTDAPVVTTTATPVVTTTAVPVVTTTAVPVVTTTTTATTTTTTVTTSVTTTEPENKPAKDPDADKWSGFVSYGSASSLFA